MGRNLVRAKKQYFEESWPAVERITKAQTLTDKKINVSISFLTLLKVMTFINFCFTCSFR